MTNLMVLLVTSPCRHFLSSHLNMDHVILEIKSYRPSGIAFIAAVVSSSHSHFSVSPSLALDDLELFVERFDFFSADLSALASCFSMTRSRDSRVRFLIA